MIDSKPDCNKVEASRGRGLWIQRGILAAVCGLVIGVYTVTAHSGYLASWSLNAADSYYNLLVQGFRAGRLDLRTAVPPDGGQVAAPFDPSAGPHSGVLDMSYYNGKLYLYYGVTPAVLLFWPYVALTNHYLLQKDAAVVFCLVGFLTSMGLLCALWRRYFAEVSVAVVATGALALGLATCTPSLLARCDVWEVPISCGYALTMLALAAVWKALHESRNRSGWLAVASLAYGLAVAARPSLLFGAVILLVPVVQAWRRRLPVWTLLIAATGPIALIGCGLMLYNALRFDSPFEFGLRYALSGDRQDTARTFGLQYLWFHFRVYFLALANWSRRFPFVHDITVPPVPAGHGRVEHPFGVLTNIPVVWLALAAPLAWRGRSADVRSTLFGFLAAVAVLFGISALMVSLFFSASIRYEVEFLPALVLLAVVGMLSVERALAPASEPWRADRLFWRRAARWIWSLLLAFSVAFNLLASVERCAEAHYNLGVALRQAGRIEEAIGHYEQAVRLQPDYAMAHINLGVDLYQLGRVEEAIGQYEQALRAKPDSFEAHNNLGNALRKLGRPQEAIGHYEQALRIRPDFAEAHYNLGGALEDAGRIQEAIGHYEQALQIRPDYAEARYNLGFALHQQGKIREAVEQLELALRFKADFAEAHDDLGNALRQLGRPQEAIGHYQQALQIRPDDAEAHNNLGNALIQLGRPTEALEHWEQALRIEPDNAEAHNNLANTLIQLDRTAEALEHWEQALRINPGLAEAHYNLGVALEKLGRTREAIQHYEQALRIKPDFAEAQNALTRARAVP
jgi:tetratricopeptide (TPR) repeat protein